MAARWQFNTSDPSSVRVGVTQRDQFNNDDVGLAEALVREVIQNSSDATSGTGPVKVSFRLKELSADEIRLLEENLQTLAPHLEACGFAIPDSRHSPVRVLSIEDFNTKGLTGSFDELDKDNFDNFWRAVGESSKSGQKGGRWGLGKLVYSSASQVRAFFGMTIRAGEDTPSVMGQAVLANHSIGDAYYPAHGFWFDERSPNKEKLQLPVQDEAEIRLLHRIAELGRTSQPGLSLVIPYLIDAVTEESILAGVVRNYYFPVLSGQLQVEVGTTLINAETLLEIANGLDLKNSPVPFAFVKKISDAMAGGRATIAEAPIGGSRLLSEHLTDEQIKEMKSVFASGNLVHLQVPVVLSPKSGPEVSGNIDIFLEAIADGEAPFSLFARGPITLPGERNFTAAIARGALVAQDDVVAEFLGDAENPAHTAWNSKAEKLRARWKNSASTLSAIRHALRDLYTLVADQKEARDDDALIDFFSIADTAQAASGKRKRTRKPKPDVPPRERAISISPHEGGFRITAGPAAKDWDYPRNIRIRIAYDMIGANPFKRFSSFDFDVRSSKELAFDVTGGVVKQSKANVLLFQVTGPEFALKAGGFDIHRDLIVDARALP